MAAMIDRSAALDRNESRHKCPACGKDVDSLRAGHVAILGDQFQYFCDEWCKRDLIASTSSPLPSEVTTAIPPPVTSDGAISESVSRLAPREPEAPARLPSSPPISTDRECEASIEEPPRTLPSAFAETSPLRVEGSAPSQEVKVLSARRPGVVVTLPRARAQAIDGARRSPEGPVSRPTPARPLRGIRVPPAVVVLGIVLGALAALLSLAGAVANATRLPLAALAAAVVVAHWALRPRDPEAAHPILGLAPVVGGVAAAVWGLVRSDPQALGFASFAGLAAAAALASDLLVANAERPTRRARERIARELSAPVRVVREGESVQVTPFDVKPGEQVVVEAGETVGVDIVVTAGDALVMPWLDAPIEGTRREGDPFVAGGKVLSGRLRGTTTWAGVDRAFYRLALSPKLRVDVAAPLARGLRLSVERGALIAGTLVAVASYASGVEGPEILASACAVALAVGARAVVSVVALHHARGHLAALSHGIVYKDAAAMDAAGRVEVAVLCPRGTVLMGEPEIVALEALANVDEGRVMALAAGAEAASTHPFASAILRAARNRAERSENVRSATIHAGLGVTALAASGERLVVGSRALLLQQKVSVAIADARVTELEAQGRSVLLVALAEKLIGLLALQDGLRPGARAAVQRLLDTQIEPVLLSGEARETCETIGHALDIEHIRPEVLPADRGVEVRALGEGGHVVAVLGHPATDDAALGAADVSVALGAAGSTPGEWTVSLASDDVRDAARALSLAHEARDHARVAMVLGLSPGIIAALAVASGLLPLGVAPVAVLLGAIAALVHARA
jgi:cation transport ATPase